MASVSAGFVLGRRALVRARIRPPEITFPGLAQRDPGPDVYFYAAASMRARLITLDVVGVYTVFR